jgi:hypothetical protein
MRLRQSSEACVMKIVDVAEFYSERGGGVRSYLDQKLTATSWRSSRPARATARSGVTAAHLLAALARAAARPALPSFDARARAAHAAHGG